MNTYGYTFTPAPVLYTEVQRIQGSAYSRQPFDPAVKSVIVTMMNGETRIVPNPRATFFGSSFTMTVQAWNPKDTARDVKCIVGIIDEDGNLTAV